MCVACISMVFGHLPETRSILLGFLLVAELDERPDGRPQDDAHGNYGDPPFGHITALDCLPPGPVVSTSRPRRRTAVSSGP
jgi:hypothetical protein